MRLYTEGGVELSIMEQQQIFICISDAFFEPESVWLLVESVWLLVALITTSFFVCDQCLHHLIRFLGFYSDLLCC